MTEHGTVYAVVVKMYEYVMGPTYCDCCGPEPVLEESGSHLDSVHKTREKAEYRVSEIDGTDIPEDYNYDNYEVSIWEASME